MAGIIPGPLVSGPEPVGRRYGLLNAASGPIDLPPHGSGGGVRYVPVTCGEAHTWPIDCSGGAVVSAAKTGDPDNAEFFAEPFVVYASIDCGSVGYTSREFVDKVERRLLNGEQGAVEYAVWTGLADPGPTPLGITNLQGSATNVTVPDEMDLASVLSSLEDYIYRLEAYGNVAYIHAPVSLAAYAAADHLIEKDGNLLKTHYGSIWVFGGGYPGTGANSEAPPDGGAYIYVTGQTTVWRSPDIFTYPVPQTLDKTNNQYMLLSEREYAVGFDCAVGRALFNPLGGS